MYLCTLSVLYLKKKTIKTNIKKKKKCLCKIESNIAFNGTVYYNLSEGSGRRIVQLYDTEQGSPRKMQFVYE